LNSKNTFNWEDKRSKAKYMKFISSAANNKGGYLIFGVESNNKIIGDASFKSIDIERLTQQINSYFIPKVNINIFLLPLNSIVCSILYVHEFEELPIICADNMGIQEEKKR
jgi:predicted HTH transcriptional regulator